MPIPFIPPELVAIIAQHVSEHQFMFEQPLEVGGTTYYQRMDRSPYHGLCQMSLVCRQFRDVVRSVKYEYVTIVDDGTNHDANTRPNMHQLIANAMAATPIRGLRYTWIQYAPNEDSYDITDSQSSTKDAVNDDDHDDDDNHINVEDGYNREANTDIELFIHFVQLVEECARRSVPLRHLDISSQYFTPFEILEIGAKIRVPRTKLNVEHLHCGIPRLLPDITSTVNASCIHVTFPRTYVDQDDGSLLESPYSVMDASPLCQSPFKNVHTLILQYNMDLSNPHDEDLLEFIQELGKYTASAPAEFMALQRLIFVNNDHVVLHEPNHSRDGRAFRMIRRRLVTRYKVPPSHNLLP